MSRLSSYGRACLGPSLVCILALALRLVYVTRQLPFQLGDEPSLYNYALNVAQGQYYGTSGAYWPPGFIFLAGWILRLAGPDPAWRVVALAQAVISGLTPALLYLWLRRQWGEAAGLAGGVLLALHTGLIFYSGRFLSETLFLALFLGCLVLLARYYSKEGWGTLIAAGLLLGLSALTRPVSLPLVLLVPAWWWLSGRYGCRAALLRGLVLTAVAAAVITPWTIRNYVVMGHPTLIDVNGGINFYLAHNPRATGTWVDVGDQDPVLAGFDRPETEQRAWAAGFSYLLAHPAEERELLGIKFNYFWTQPDWDVEQYGQPLYDLARRWRLPLVELRLLEYLALPGVLLALRRWRQALLPALFIFYYHGLILALYFAPRYRMVAEPLLAYFAGIALGAAAEATWWAAKWLVNSPLNFSARRV